MLWEYGGGGGGESRIVGEIPPFPPTWVEGHEIRLFVGVMGREE